MGTSNSHGGPGSNKPLLPPWANDPIQPFPPLGDLPTDGDTFEPHEQPETPADSSQTPDIVDTPPDQWIRPSQALGSARWSTSRYVNSGGEGGAGGGFKSYTKSLGGAGRATRASRSGRSATRRLGGYLSNISSSGISSASEDLGISDILGKPVNVAISQIIDKLAPEAATLDDAVTRRAMSKTLEELYSKYNVEGQGLEALNGIDENGVEEAVILSTINYVFEKFLLDLVDRIESKNISEEEVLRLERQMKEYIKVKVEKKVFEGQSFRGIDWFGKVGNEITRDIYQHVYEILEAI